MSIENLQTQISNAGDAVDRQVRDALTDPHSRRAKTETGFGDRPNDFRFAQTTSPMKKGCAIGQGVIDAIKTLSPGCNVPA